MGLMTMLTGKNRLQRQIEKLEDTRGKENENLILKFREQLDFQSGEEMVSAISLLNVCSAINMFLTHYLRTQLSMHPKWISQGNFDDEGPALVAWIRPHMNILNQNSLDLKKRFSLACIAMDFSFNDNAPDFRSIMENMTKSADLKGMCDRYPEELKRGINIMNSMYRSLCIQSSIETDPDDLLNFFEELRPFVFSDWRINNSGVYS